MITMPKALTDKLGDAGATALAQMFNEADTETRKALVTKGDLSAGLSDTKAELIKWMFIFWVGQVATTVGILSIFFKK